MLVAKEQQQVWGRRSLPVACPPPVERQATKSDGLPHVVISCPFNYARLYTSTCLECHSPVAVLTGDRALRRKVSWEGITCDYCHSIRDISLSGTNPRVKVEFSLVKSGPLKDIQAPVHEAVFSPLHTSSIACAPCHEYRNFLGLPVLTTFSEWKNSRYAKQGKACQSCHMYEVAGDVVDPKIRKSALAQVNLHQMPGSHSITQLNKTVKLRLSSTRENDQLKVSVEVSNVAAGHYVPTGSPLRQLVLEVQADPYNGAHFRQERRYQRTVTDRQGAVVVREHAAFFNGAKVLSDTRLAPDETRTELFSFPAPSGVAVQLKATLWYYYSPLARNEAEKRVTFNTISRLVRQVRRRRPRLPPGAPPCQAKAAVSALANREG